MTAGWNRTAELLGRARPMPLGVAVDFLTEEGFSFLEGLGVNRRGRMERLRGKLKKHLPSYAGTRPCCWVLRRMYPGAQLWWSYPLLVHWEQREWVLDARSSMGTVAFGPTLIGRRWVNLYQDGLPSPHVFSPEAFTRLFVLTWLADRFYRRQ